MMDDQIVGINRVRMHETADNWNSENVIMLIVRIALVAVFVWAVVVLVNQLVKYLSSKSTENLVAPIDVAKRRLASGEITVAQYNELKKELK